MTLSSFYLLCAKSISYWRLICCCSVTELQPLLLSWAWKSSAAGGDSANDSGSHRHTVVDDGLTDI